MDIGQEIKRHRAALGISQTDLAEISEVSLATIKDIERGKGNPSLSTIEKIAETLGLELRLEQKVLLP